MNKKRLLLVAKALRESPNPADFIMRRFGYDCGTPACALGHYAFRKDLQKIFKLNRSGYVARTVNGKDINGIEDPAVLKHFGITPEQTQLLFNGSSGCGCAETADSAAVYIERFVEEHA